MSDANDLLMSGGIPWVSFPTVGTEVTVTFLKPPTSRQSKDIVSGKPETWEDGSPKNEIVCEVSTELRDPSIAFDDGKRQLVMKLGGNLAAEMRAAIRRAGEPGIKPGGMAVIRFVREEPVLDGNGRVKPGMNPKKIFEIYYQGPAGNDLMGAPQQQQAPAAYSPIQAQQTGNGWQQPSQPQYQQPPMQQPQYVQPQQYGQQGYAVQQTQGGPQIVQQPAQQFAQPSAVQQQYDAEQSAVETLRQSGMVAE